MITRFGKFCHLFAPTRHSLYPYIRAKMADILYKVYST